MDDRETLKVAVGLTRRAATLLSGIGLVARAGELEAAIETTLELHEWLRNEEMTPELACLAAGIPLEEVAVVPREEVPPPANLSALRAAAAGPRLAWRQKG